MKIKKKILIIALIFALFFIFNKVSSYAQENELVSIEYDIKVRSNGDMDVVETWQVYIDQLASIHKYFETTEDNTLSNIQNIRLTEVIDNQEISFEEGTITNANLSEDNYFAIQASPSKMFITWNPKQKSTAYVDTKIYKIYYTIKNALKMYNDCAEIEWDFFDSEDSMPVKGVAGMISLEELSTRFENVRVWGHDDLEDKLVKVTEGDISFDRSYPYKTIDELGFRIVTDTNIKYTGQNKINRNMLTSILEEEPTLIESRVNDIYYNDNDEDYDDDYYYGDYDYNYDYDDNNLDDMDDWPELYENFSGASELLKALFAYVVVLIIVITVLKIFAPFYKIENNFKLKNRYNYSTYRNNNYRKKAPIYDEEINTITNDDDNVIKDYNNSASGYIELILFIILIVVIAYFIIQKIR